VVQGCELMAETFAAGSFRTIVRCSGQLFTTFRV